MTRLLITRGLPASGKTTFARKLQPGVVRVNRDDLRRMLHGQRLFTQWAEGQVTHAQRAAVEALLRARADVIVDDTNLRGKTVREWAELAARFDATFEVHDFTDVPLEECLRRDADRPEDEQVGEEPIRRMHERYLAGKNLPLPVPYVDPGGPGVVYQPDPELPPVVLVDIDGTVALMSGRSPFDWSRVGEDAPNPAVIAAVRAMHAAGHAHRVLLGPGRRLPGGDAGLAGPLRRSAVRRHYSCGRPVTAVRTRSSSGRSSTRRSASAGGWSACSTTVNRWYGCGAGWG